MHEVSSPKEPRSSFEAGDTRDEDRERDAAGARQPGQQRCRAERPARERELQRDSASPAGLGHLPVVVMPALG